MSYEFHPAAEAEFLESVGHYESRVPGLGGALIEETPTAWQIECQPDIRRGPLHRFPVSLIYREREGELHILAFAHHRRRPQYWLDRR